MIYWPSVLLEECGGTGFASADGILFSCGARDSCCRECMVRGGAEGWVTGSLIGLEKACLYWLWHLKKTGNLRIGLSAMLAVTWIFSLRVALIKVRSNSLQLAKPPFSNLYIDYFNSLLHI